MDNPNTQQQVRERIRDTAGAMFMKYGIRSISMDDISVNLGMSKKTLYQYFQDKDQLVDAIIEQHTRQIRTDCLASCAEAENAVEEVFLTMDKVTAHMGSVNPSVLHDMHKFHHNSYLKFQETRHAFLFGIIQGNLQRGIREGLYRNDLDVDVLSKYRLESMMAPFNMDLFPAGAYNILDVVRIILEHFIFGLVTPKGYALIERYKQERNKSMNHDNK